MHKYSSMAMAKSLPTFDEGVLDEGIFAKKVNLDWTSWVKSTHRRMLQ